MVIEYLTVNSEIEMQFKLFTEKEIESPAYKIDFENLIVDSPSMENASEPIMTLYKKPIKINYLEKEQANRNLGMYGEEIVLKYEKWNLIRVGKEKLAEKIEWISREEGDGAGFDILSKNLNGTDKYIEVKTTKLGKETPIFFSYNELNFSINSTSNYHLFRLFNAEHNVKMFIKNGPLNEICYSVPTMYKGYF
jgi:hypothetical protein